MFARFRRSITPALAGLALWTAIVASAAAQSSPEIKLYHGADEITIDYLPLTRPTFVSLFDLARGLRMEASTDSDGRVVLARNHRRVTIDRVRQEAILRQQRRPFAVREKNGALYVRVDAATRLFSDFLGVRVIYEPTSRSIHAPVPQDLRVTTRLRRVQDTHRLTIIYSQAIEPPSVEMVGRKLLLKIKASPVVWDRAAFRANEAITALELYEDLPDGTTEALFSIGDKARRYEVEPYSVDNPRTVIKVFGAFAPVPGPATTSASSTPGIRRICIDPGHGGIDRGAIGPTGLQEKDVNLLLAKRLKQLLENQRFEVRLTRDRDTLLSLKTRTAMANNFNADLFLSIHANAIKLPNATGSETYYLSPENNPNFDNTHYERYDHDENGEAGDELTEVDDDLSLMLWDMAQTKHIEDSFRFAKYIQEELNKLAGTRNRGVKQAPLKVLKGATMPAVLIETAFISNRAEEQKLKNLRFQEKIADAILAAVKNYDDDVKKRARQKYRAADSEEGRTP